MDRPWPTTTHRFQDKERAIVDSFSTETKSPQHKTLLIGINDYQEPMSKLAYCVGDVRLLAETFAKAGVDPDNMILMTDDTVDEKSKPTRANIFIQLRRIMRDATEDDTITIVFSGHGLHNDGASYLCPSDGDPDVPETLISHREITRIMDISKAKRKLFLIDACRNSPILKGGKSGSNVNRGFDKVFDAAQGTAFLLSCSEDEVSWEFEELNHGVFTHFITRGLNGEADENEDDQVSLMELNKYVSEQTKKYVKAKRGRNQTPAFKGNISDGFDKFILTRKGAKPKPRTKEKWEQRMVFGSLSGHTRTVTSMAISPDGKILASTGFDGTMRLWNTQTDKGIYTFRNAGGSFEHVSFSPDGKMLLAIYKQESDILFIWSLDNYKKIRALENVSDGVFSPDGKDVLAISKDGVLMRWNIISGELIHACKNHYGFGFFGEKFSEVRFLKREGDRHFR